MIRHPKQTMLIRVALLPVLMAILFVGTAFSQSLADLARQERQKKGREAKSPRLFTNEDIPGTPSSPAPAASAPAKTGQTKPPEGSSEAGKTTAIADKTTDGKEAAKPSEQDIAALEKEYRERFAKLRDAVAVEEKKLDVMQRELNLMQTQYYSDPNVALREQTFRGQINQRTQEIDQQKAAVEKAKLAIVNLEEELRKKGLPAGWSR